MVGEAIYGQGKVSRGTDGWTNDDRGKDVVPIKICLCFVSGQEDDSCWMVGINLD